MNARRWNLLTVAALLLTAWGWANAAPDHSISALAPGCTVEQLEQEWNLIQAAKQADQEITEEMYAPYYALFGRLYPERGLEGSGRGEGDNLDQGYDRCPGLVINQTFPMTWVDYGQTYNYGNDCRRPNCRDGKDIVYQFNVTQRDSIIISTCGSTFDTWLCVYQDVCCSSTPLFSNDDNWDICGAHTMLSGVAACFDPGTYYIVLDGYGRSAYGHYALSINGLGNACIPPIQPVDCPPEWPRHFEDGIDDEPCGEGNMFLECPAGLCGAVDGLGDIDVFDFSIDQCSVVTLTVYGNDTPGHHGFTEGLDPYVILYNSVCEDALYTNFDYNDADHTGDVLSDDARIVTLCLRYGEYHVEVGGQNETDGPYEFWFDCVPCGNPEPLDITYHYEVPGCAVQLTWPSSGSNFIYYVWRYEDVDGSGFWQQIATTPNLFYCDTYESEWTVIYAVFDNPCGEPSGGPQLRGNTQGR
ncbi:hypothetical protein HZB60_11890 [candidate division KSB1 bacterium]|nr:hypothetical protein [candidate division KSB1 bacterium]